MARLKRRVVQGGVAALLVGCLGWSGAVVSISREVFVMEVEPTTHESWDFVDGVEPTTQ